MSIYTDQEHEMALRDTLHWQEQVKDTTESMYQYADYLFRLKDYETACTWYEKAVIQGYPPAMYKLAFCLRNELAGRRNLQQEEVYFSKALAYFSQHSAEKEHCYYCGMCFRYGYGTRLDEQKAFHYFEQAGDDCAKALYEIGLYYQSGIANLQQDKNKAASYFRRAYDGHCEDAIFALFSMHESCLQEFPYAREIKEAYSFKLGQLMRIAESKPSFGSLKRLANFYRQGFPGDTGHFLENFHQKADRYEKKAQQYT